VFSQKKFKFCVQAYSPPSRPICLDPFNGAQCRGVDGCLGGSRFWGRRGKSGACPGAASRVVVRELLVWSPSVRRLEGWADRRPEAAQRRAWQCPVVPGFHSVGMTLQCLGWRHSDEDDHTGPEVTEETCSAGLTSRHPPLPSFFAECQTKHSAKF
jgi:hypothetical protein